MIKATTQYTVPLRNEPGELHRMLRVLARAGIAVTALDCVSVNHAAFAHFLTRGPGGRQQLEAAGYQVLERPCLQAEIGARAEEFDRALKCLAEEGINLEGICATRTCVSAGCWTLVLSLEEPERAHAALVKLESAAAA